MKEEHPAPQNCKWWSIGESTPNPPEDAEFLRILVNAGFDTFISTNGLIGAVSGDRYVDVIHRGRGRRWRIGFATDGAEVYSASVNTLPKRAEAAVAWLRNESIAYIEQTLDPKEDGTVRPIES